MMKLIIHTLFSQEFTLTIEWKMSNLLTSVANTGCLLWNTCAAQGIFTFLIHLLHEFNYFRCAEHAVSPHDSQSSPSQGFMMRKVLLG